MLESDNLDDTRYNELYKQALSSARELAPGWDDLRTHDPGITILETMALLCDMQNYLCNMVTEEHLHKYLRLLGHQPVGIRPAHACITVKTPEQDIRLPSDSLFQTDTLPFETEQEANLYANQISQVFIKREGTLRECALFLEYRVGKGIPVFSQKGEALYIGFKQPLASTQVVSLYIGVEASPERRPPSKEMPPLVDLLWEAWDGEHWTAVGVQDETCAFLCSGFVHITARLLMKQRELSGQSAFFLRVRLIHGEYDLPPVLKRLRLNVLPVTQRKTLARTVELSGASPFRVHTRLCQEGITRILIPASQDAWKELTEGFRWDGDSTGSRLLHIQDSEVQRVRVVCTDRDWQYPRKLTGVTSQRVSLGVPGIPAESLTLMLRGKDGLWRDYSVFLHPPGGETVLFGCLFFPGQGVLLFGDGGDFCIPPPALDGLLITNCAVTMGAEGNAAAFSICSGPVECMNEEPADGGRNQETAQEALAVFREKIQYPERAVILSDYQRIAMQTPGLALHKVKAFPLSLLYKGRDGVVIVAKSAGNGRTNLPSRARDIIRKHLEPFRMLSVRIEILNPRYLPIKAELHLSLWENGSDKEGEVLRVVRDFTDGMEGPLDFGELISHARLFSALSNLSFVHSVRELYLRPIGNAGSRLPSGDIQPQPDALPFLEDCRLLLQ